MLDLINAFSNNINTNNKQSIILEPSLQKVIDYLPEIICWKDENSVFQGCNKTLANILHLDHPMHIIGKTAKDIVRKNSQEIEEDDYFAMNSKSVHSITRTVFYSDSQAERVRGNIIPLINSENEIKGILCIGFIEKQQIYKNFSDFFDMINPVNINEILKKKKYLITTQLGKTFISKREVECLLYLIKGYSTKKIAAEMSLARRTVDAYIENIKNKLGITTRVQLISYAMSASFLKQLGLEINS